MPPTQFLVLVQWSDNEVITCCEDVTTEPIFRIVAITYIVKLFYFISFKIRGLSWSWSYGSLIYMYMCNQSLSPLTLWVRNTFMARCTRSSIMWSSLSVTCDRSIVFSGYFGFLHQQYWPPRYDWNIVESGVKHLKPNQTKLHLI